MLACKTFSLRILAVSCLLATTALGQASAEVGVQWHGDLDAAREVAQKEGKLLLIHFWTESCGPCRLLDTRVFNQQSVAGAIDANYVPVKLNASEFPATAQRFGITRVPTDIVITPGGEVLDKAVCPSTPMAYIAQVTRIARAHQRKSGRSFEQVAGSGPTVPPSNAAYAQLAVPADSAQGTPAGANREPRVTANPYANGGQLPTVTTTDRYAAQPSTPVAPQTPPADRYAALPPAPPTVGAPTANPYAQTTPPPVTPVAPLTPEPEVVPAASAPPVEATVQLPAGSPPLGFDGYCPVTMKSQWNWKKGDARWGVVHRGRTYLFAGAEQRDAFLATPDKFSPALSGVDPVLAIDQNKVEAGSRKFAVEYRGQFYMFSSEETLRQFWTDADKYANGVRQAMNGTLQRTLR